MKKAGFCEKKFRSMLLTGTFTMAVLYIMLLCDSIIAGLFIGSTGVAAINAVTPITGIVTFFATIISEGSGILYSREIGVMNKRRANELYGQGLILSVVIALLSAALMMACRNVYFEANGITGEIYDLAIIYYRWSPLNAVLSVIVCYFSQMVYTDGDESCNNLSYVLQIGGNVSLSVCLTRAYGMVGIIMGTIFGNILGLIALSWHFFKKSNTLHFVRHFSFGDFKECVKFSIVDAVIYLCWGVMDYILIGHVAAGYGETGQVVFAVLISVIEFSVVMDGVGMAVQPLLGTYLGENNHVLLKRLMKSAVYAAVIEGIVANILVFVFARQFCGLFGVTGGMLVPCTQAVRIVSFGMVFCSAVSLMTSYYMLIDHVALSVVITVLKDGFLYTVLPILGSGLFGENGMWAAFAAAPVLTLILSFGFIRFYFGKKRFPYVIEMPDTEIIVLEDTLTPEHAAGLSQGVEKALKDRNYGRNTIVHAALFTEEIGLAVIERNKKKKAMLLAEFSLILDRDSVLVIERDSGEIFDITDPDMDIKGISSFIISGLMEAHNEKAYLTTTGYNRNMIRFTAGRTNQVKEDMDQWVRM